MVGLPFPSNLLEAVGALNPTWFALAGFAILLDLLTGFAIKGVLAHDVRSSAMREGLVHKSWEVAVIACAALVDVALAAGMRIEMQPVSDVTCAFVLVMEAASVCENALEGNPELASAPIFRYVSGHKGAEGDDPDATTVMPRVPKHIERGE